MSLSELAERCEKATGPDDALEWDIAAATSWQNKTWCPDYTVSLDAAITLVPEGWHIGSLYDQFQARKWRASVAQLPTEGQLRAFNDGKTFGVECEHAEAATGPLALCAAALKARAASVDRSPEGQDAGERLDAQHESEVGSEASETPNPHSDTHNLSLPNRGRGSV